MALGFGFDLMSQAVRQRPWTPRFLFGDGEQGAWYDPSDFATLYQDSAGTTPVTALGQPVGLMQDKSGNGNHASQSTAAARPTVQARANLLTDTEGIGGVDWDVFGVTVQGNQDIAPDGTTSGTRITTSVGSAQNIVRQASLPEWDNNTTASIYAKQIDCRYLAISGIASSFLTNHVYAVFDLADGDVETTQNCTAVMQEVGGGWYRCALSKTADSASPQVQFVIAPWESVPAGSPTVPYTATGKSLSVWHPQLERNGSATTYQRVTTATDYADIGLPRYLEFDGVDDALSTASIDFTGTDEMTAVMGMSEYVGGAGIELGTNAALVNGSFLMWGDVAGATGLQKGYYSRGTALSKVEETSNTTTFVLAGVSKISSDTAILREDGLVLNTSTTDQGTGNYADHPLYIGARGGTTIELNGRIHQLIIRGATTAGNLLDQTERFVARKTGVTL